MSFNLTEIVEKINDDIKNHVYKTPTSKKERTFAHLTAFLQVHFAKLIGADNFPQFWALRYSKTFYWITYQVITETVENRKNAIDHTVEFTINFEIDGKTHRLELAPVRIKVSASKKEWVADIRKK